MSIEWSHREADSDDQTPLGCGVGVWGWGIIGANNRAVAAAAGGVTAAGVFEAHNELWRKRFGVEGSDNKI